MGVEDLQSAVSLNASAFNAARMVGPALAGVMVAAWGEGVCFAVNAFSYLAVLVALLTIRTPRAPSAPSSSMRAELAEGVRYAWGNVQVRTMLGGIAVTSVFGLSYTTLLPVFARDVLHGGVRGFGVLMASGGLGAVVGALAAAARRSARGTGVIMAAGQGALGLGLVALAFTRHPGGGQRLDGGDRPRRGDPALDHERVPADHRTAAHARAGRVALHLAVQRAVAGRRVRGGVDRRARGRAAGRRRAPERRARWRPR